MKDKIQETAHFLKKKISIRPEILIILGSGLSKASEVVRQEAQIRYQNIPHFNKTRVVTHEGRLIFGTLGNKKVMVMAGRVHAYEGYSLWETTFPVRVAALLGAKMLITTNLAGGISKNLRVGDLMVITDHLNLSGDNPLVGYSHKNQFVDMYNAYDPLLISSLSKAAKKSSLIIKKGVLAYLTGPSFETRAELFFLKGAGADAIGWSLVPETIVAHQEGMKVLGISCISDSAHPEKLCPVDLPVVFETGLNRAKDLGRLLECLLNLIQ